MKKLFLSLLVTGFATMMANAQFYDFSATTGSYSAITGLTLSGADWDDETYTIIPSYDVTIFGQVIDSMHVSDYGLEFFSAGNSLGFFAACSGDLASFGGTESPIVWLETGSAPNRVLKIEYQNATTFNDLNGIASDTINYQIWFNESDNSIELHFGNSIVVQDGDDPWDGYSGPIVGFENDLGRGIALSGDSSSPTVNIVDENTNEEYSLMGMPSEGTVYVFTPRTFQITVPTVANVTLISAYPNPFNGQLTINTEVKMDFVLTDAQGKEIATFTVDGEYVLNTTDLNHGVYFLRSSSGSVIKLVK